VLRTWTRCVSSMGLTSASGRRETLTRDRLIRLVADRCQLGRSDWLDLVSSGRAPDQPSTYWIRSSSLDPWRRVPHFSGRPSQPVGALFV
jgi:hypothetical protein